uniref:Uncharacterized protein n=1 Tax=Craspedostauros australis TaxID=1486917 RepID=A0A7R9WPY0_9STRA
MMMGHDVLFDMKHNRIGFAESDCDLSEVLATNGLPSVFDFPPRNPSSPATSIKNELDDNDTSIGDSIDGGTKKDATVNSGSGPSELEIFMKECDNSCKVILVCVGVVIIFLMLCIYRVYCTSSDVRAEYMRANTQEMTPIAPCDPDVEDDIELPQWDGDMDMRNTSGEYRDDPIDEDVPDDELEYADHSDSSASE